MLQINETWIRIQDDNHRYSAGESDWYHPYTEDLGKLFRDLRRQYGRCTGKVYLDGPDGVACPVGWVFETRRQFEDCAETYMAETWVTYRQVLAA